MHRGLSVRSARCNVAFTDPASQQDDGTPLHKVESLRFTPKDATKLLPRHTTNTSK